MDVRGIGLGLSSAAFFFGFAFALVVFGLALTVFLGLAFAFVALRPVDLVVALALVLMVVDFFGFVAVGAKRYGEVDRARRVKRVFMTAARWILATPTGLIAAREALDARERVRENITVDNNMIAGEG